MDAMDARRIGKNLQNRQDILQILQILHTLKRNIHIDSKSELNIDDAEFNNIKYIFPVNQSAELFNTIMLIVDRDKLDAHLMNKRTNEWAKVVYKLLTPILTHIINDIVVTFLFDFITKAMIVTGQHLPISLDSHYGMIFSMFLNNQLSKYTAEYVNNLVMYYTSYNGYNCTLPTIQEGGASKESLEMINMMKNINWSLVTYVFVELCVKLYKTAKDPLSHYRSMAIVLLLCVMFIMILMIKKIKIE